MLLLSLLPFLLPFLVSLLGHMYMHECGNLYINNKYDILLDLQHLQMGHLLVYSFTIYEQLLQMHRCLHGSIIVSFIWL